MAPLKSMNNEVTYRKSSACHGEFWMQGLKNVILTFHHIISLKLNDFQSTRLLNSNSSS